MMVDDAEESQLKGPIDFLAPYTSWRSTISSMSLSKAVRRRDPSRPKIPHVTR